jgi:L,D-transpeptidase YnhG
MLFRRFAKTRIGMCLPQKQILLSALLAFGALTNAVQALPQAASKSGAQQPRLVTAPQSQVAPVSLEAEEGLLKIYRLVAQGQTKKALTQAEHLVQLYPHFQLAQLVYGDLLRAQTKPLAALGDANDEAFKSAGVTLDNLREEARVRLNASRERPSANDLPEQFLQLPASSKHAIAVDASKSRLYLFENTAQGLKLISDFYISVGKLGVDKHLEGDQRTPLGVYFITNTLDRKTLKDFYGTGALPINYPNVLDQRLGRTGSGIWLHGTPSNQFSRAPKATDGCVVLSNPDLDQLLRTVQIRTTPVVIAPKLNWQSLSTLNSTRQSFTLNFEAWRLARSKGEVDKAMSHYAYSFSNNGKTLNDWREMFDAERVQYAGKAVQVKDLSILRSPAMSPDSLEAMVVTFSELREGARTGVTKRQYWQREKLGWKIVYEGNLS